MTNFKFNLRFYMCRKKYGAYTERDALYRVRKIGKFKQEMKDQYLQNEDGRYLKGLISTKWKWRKWVLVLDCDNSDNLGRAINELRHLNISYHVIESSPFHYWVVTDIVSSVKKCIMVARAIPGVDRNFIDFCERHRKIVFRAFTKDGFIPRSIRVNEIPENTLRRKAPCFALAHRGDDIAGVFIGKFLDWWNDNEFITWLHTQQTRHTVGQSPVFRTIPEEILQQASLAQQDSLYTQFRREMNGATQNEEYRVEAKQDTAPYQTTDLPEPEKPKKHRLIRLEKEK